MDSRQPRAKRALTTAVAETACSMVMLLVPKADFRSSLGVSTGGACVAHARARSFLSGVLGVSSCWRVAYRLVQGGCDAAPATAAIAELSPAACSMATTVQKCASFANSWTGANVSDKCRGEGGEGEWTRSVDRKPFG